VTYKILDLICAVVSLLSPAIDWTVRQYEHSVLDWSQRQINIIEATDKPYPSTVWMLQPKSDLRLARVALAIIYIGLVFYKEPALIFTAPCNFAIGTLKAIFT